ncbi:unnamed protein product [Heterobilharzia americana]|nr:unnamed protein product [Heterobilharzia americana]
MEVQRQITMLKRKLKQHEKSNEQQQQQQQPSSTELPIEPILITTTTVTGDDELPCSKTLNSATYSDNTVVCSQTPTISSVNEETIKKEISSVTTTVVTTTTTTPLLVNDDESKLLKSPNELLTVNRDDGDDDKKDQDINASLKETVKITNTSTTSTGYSTDGIETHPDTISISDIHESQQDESTAKLNQIPTNHDQVIEEANDLNCIHPTKISLKTDNDLYNQNSKITTVYRVKQFLALQTLII